MSRKVVILTAPSGSGKTTLARALMKVFPVLEFSVSATTRPPRSYEKEGVHYYFFSPEDFKHEVSKGSFCEYEEVYPDQFYGTLNRELERIWNRGMMVLFDVDVKGAISLKNQFQDDCLSFFIQAPSLDELRNRLIRRGTEDEQSLKKRLDRAAYEMEHSQFFDQVIINDEIPRAVQDLKTKLIEFLIDA